MSVQFSRIDGSMLRLWQLIDDACAGEHAIKKRHEAYLPMLNPTDLSTDNKTRNAQYRLRASYFNAAGRTKSALVGVAFAKKALLNVPAALEYVKYNASGDGLSVEQLAHKLLGNMVALGRAGVLVDYPSVDAVQSRAQSRDNQATIVGYHPRDIINWDSTMVDGHERFTLIVLREKFTMRNADGFTHTEAERYRVLELIDGIYNVRIFEYSTKGFIETANFQPRDGAGSVWHEIPFTFVGSENNDALMDQPPLADLAQLNIAHYRNSADLEEGSFIAGQPTLAMIGVTQQWYDSNIKGQVYLGVRGGIALNAGADIKLVQAEANSLPLELMKHKEDQMVKLGARLMMPSINVTATATNSSDKSAFSVLALCCANVSTALTQCLKWCGRFMNVEGGSFEINQDFVTNQLTAQDLIALMQLWQSGTTAKTDVRALLRRFGFIAAERTDEQIDDDLSTETVPLMP